MNRFEDDQFIFDFVNDKRVYETELEDHIVYPIINNTYLHTAIALLGINATGKTTVVTILSEMLNIFIQNESLNYNSPFKNYINNRIQTVNYIQHEQTLYKIESVIMVDNKRERLYFGDETLYSKKLTKDIARKDLFDFNQVTKPLMQRELLKTETLFGTFLKEEDSIFSSVLNTQENKELMVQDLLHTTNFNFLSGDSEIIPLSFIHYLDSSIEVFEVLSDENQRNTTDKFRLKFYDSDEEIIVDYVHLDSYLSSGTIKGISVLLSVLTTLENGGYLIVDEIENHLNKAIVLSIINLFQSPLNKSGATIIFSTHYQEIIDGLSRTDSMYILRKKEKISIIRFSELLEKYDRKDKVKSEVLLSGIFNTAPKYEKFMSLKRDLTTLLKEDRGD